MSVEFDTICCGQNCVDTTYMVRTEAVNLLNALEIQHNMLWS